MTQCRTITVEHAFAWFVLLSELFQEIFLIFKRLIEEKPVIARGHLFKKTQMLLPGNFCQFSGVGKQFVNYFSGSFYNVFFHLFKRHLIILIRYAHKFDCLRFLLTHFGGGLPFLFVVPEGYVAGPKKYCCSIACSCAARYKLSVQSAYNKLCPR